MTKKRIGIIGAPDEQHCLRVKSIVEAKGATPVVIDTTRFPTAAKMTYANDEFAYEGEDLSSVRGFYVRSVFYSLPFFEIPPEGPAAAADHDPAAADRRRTDEPAGSTEKAEAAARSGRSMLFENWYLDWAAERERQSFLTSWVRCIQEGGAVVANPIESFDLHYLKLLQLELERKAGIPIPRTCATNDPQRLLAFCEEVKNVIYKPIAGGAECQRLLTHDLKDERLELLASAPVLFQEEIPGENIRVYVVGDRVVSAAVIVGGDLDYRGHEESIDPIELPDDVAQMAVEATKLCGMLWTGADFRRRPDGSYVLLECNPSPMFLAFEHWTKDPIAETLVDLLLAADD